MRTFHSELQVAEHRRAQHFQADTADVQRLAVKRLEVEIAAEPGPAFIAQLQPQPQPSATCQRG